MATLGQVNSLFSVVWVDGADEVLASCELEPNNWLNLLPIEELEEELDEELVPPEDPNMLPPPQPDNVALATTSSAIPAACFKCLLTIIASAGPEIRPAL